MSKGKKVSRAWGTDFITGVLATAIGVGLSFAVNNMVENHKKDQARRHTAMMAVYDIDEIARQLREYRQKEDILYNVTQYMSTHQEEIDSAQLDTLRMAVTYLTEDVAEFPKWADDTKEKAFNSSMDAWQNLDNTRFYDNVQACYRLRSELLKSMETDVIFSRPLSDEEFNRFFLQVSDQELDYSGGMGPEALARLLKQVLKQPTATRYLRTYFLRTNVLGKCADDLVRLNQENKFMMNITDADIGEYIRKNVDKTRPPTVRKLTGDWMDHQDEDRWMEFSLRPDMTASLTGHVVFNLSIYLKEEDVTVGLNCPVVYSIQGQWSLQQDSLKMVYDPATSEILSFDVDMSNLPKSALEREKDKLETWKQEYQDGIMETIRQNTWSWTDLASLDMTGNILFLKSQHTTAWGQTETGTQQLVRKQKE